MNLIKPEKQDIRGIVLEQRRETVFPIGSGTSFSQKILYDLKQRAFIFVMHLQHLIHVIDEPQHCF
ncbi:hypothetical protein D3C76_1471700 [compost metagenome]